MNSIGRSHLPDVLMVTVTRWLLKCHPSGRGQFVLWGSVLYFWPQTVQFRGGVQWMVWVYVCGGSDSSGTIYLFLLKQCLSLAGSSSLRLDWVAKWASERHLCLPPQNPIGITNTQNQAQLFCFIRNLLWIKVRYSCSCGKHFTN